MVSSPHSRLTPLQLDLLGAFFAREKRFFLTGGGALAGYYLGHRDTEDLDLFGSSGLDADDAVRKALVDQGIDLGQALQDARRKDGGAEPATLAWVLDQIHIGPKAALPGGVDAAELLAFRDAFTTKLRALAFERATGDA